MKDNLTVALIVCGVAIVLWAALNAASVVPGVFY